MNIEQRLSILEKKIGIREQSEIEAEPKEIKSKLPKIGRFPLQPRAKSYMKRSLNGLTYEKFILGGYENYKEVCAVATKFYFECLKERKKAERYLDQFSFDSLEKLDYHLARYSGGVGGTVIKYPNRTKEKIISSILNMFDLFWVGEFTKSEYNRSGIFKYFQYWCLDWNPLKEKFELNKELLSERDRYWLEKRMKRSITDSPYARRMENY